MFRDRIVLLFLAVVCVWTGPVRGCHEDSASNCPHYTLVNQVSFIPTPDPDQLDQLCGQLQESLRCLLGPMVFGSCPAASKIPYKSMLNVLQFPCYKFRSDYRSGRSCWKSSGLKALTRRCYMRHRDAIDENYCNGQKDFVNCTSTNILTVDNCGEREQRILTSMVISSYNDNGLSLNPPCHALTMPPESTTTTTTTTPRQSTTTPRKTTTTISTRSPGQQTSYEEASSPRSLSKSKATTRTTRGSEEHKPITSKSGKGSAGGMVTQASRSSAGDRTASVCGRVLVFGALAALLIFV